MTLQIKAASSSTVCAEKKKKKKFYSLGFPFLHFSLEYLFVGVPLSFPDDN